MNGSTPSNFDFVQRGEKCGDRNEKNWYLHRLKGDTIGGVGIDLTKVWNNSVLVFYEERKTEITFSVNFAIFLTFIYYDHSFLVAYIVFGTP